MQGVERPALRDARRGGRPAANAALARAARDERSRIVRLQASAGNHAVSQLMRVGKTAAKRLKKRDSPVTLAVMTKFQQDGELSDADVDSLLTLSDEQVVQAMAMPPKKFKTISEDLRPADFFASVKRGAELAKTASAAPKALKPAEVLAEELVTKGVLKDTATAFIAKEGTAGVKGWIADKSDNAVVSAAALCTRSTNASTLEKIDALVVTDAAGHAYGIEQLLRWAVETSIGRVEEALTETAADDSVAYVAAWLKLGATASSTQSYKNICRLKGRLAGGEELEVFQKDVPYRGSHDPPSRTGFLRHTFGDGTSVELHTHWNTTKRIIASIHVKDGPSKSTELNSWGPQLFGDVNAAVLAAHNASVDYPPTTKPKDRPLTLV
jgi:hypothetical protein